MSGFYASGIRQIRSEWVAAPTIVRTYAVLDLALPGAPDTLQAVERLKSISIKMGLLIRQDQQVQELACSEVVGQEDGTVSADLATVFGMPAGQKWVGFVFKPAPTPTHPIPAIAEYGLRLQLTGITTLPQLIPAPSRYANHVSFADSHLSALWVIPAVAF
jgi:hypothetical protein